MERIVEPEWLDDLPAQDPSAVGSRRDLQRLNAWMGSPRRFARLLSTELKPTVPCNLADLGGGDGRFFLQAARLMEAPVRAGQVTLLDRHDIVTRQTRQHFARLGWRLHVVQTDIFAWLEQQNERVWDIMVANLFLHHFTDAQLSRLLAQAAKKCRTFVALEPRRSLLALVFSSCVRLIGCNHVTRHDAPASVRAGFSGNELMRLWPSDKHWAVEEHHAGLFAHMFVARWSNGEYERQAHGERIRLADKGAPVSTQP